ncbi:MAG: hypothetical protein SPI25_07360 [Dialister sp.]|nr:hypothetical protein [Dialister sp.]
MKKAILSASLSFLLMAGVSAAEPATLTEKIDRLDQVVYGDVQSGSLLHRVDAADTVIYGKGNTSGSGLDDRVSNLYSDVIHSGNDKEPSIATRLNALEYYLTDEIKQEPLETRMSQLETAVNGQAKTGALNSRMVNLEKAVYGDSHYEMKDVTLPKDTVFKISLNEDVSSRTSKVGDAVTFTVEEDVQVDNVLVLPRGAQGSGVITKVSRPKMFGRSGALDISFDQVFSIDDEVIPTVLGPESKEKLKMEAAAIGASAIGALALGPIGLVGGLFVKGKDVDMPAGSQLYIQTQSDVTTKGMVMVSGVPNVTLRKTVSKSATDTSERTKTVMEETVVEETVPAGTFSDAAREELKTIREGGTADEEDNSNEEASVVIVRND